MLSRAEHRANRRLLQREHAWMAIRVAPRFEIVGRGQNELGLLGRFIRNQRGTDHEGHLRQSLGEAQVSRKAEGRVRTQGDHRRHRPRPHVIGQSGEVRQGGAGRRRAGCRSKHRSQIPQGFVEGRGQNVYRRRHVGPDQNGAPTRVVHQVLHQGFGRLTDQSGLLCDGLEPVGGEPLCEFTVFGQGTDAPSHDDCLHQSKQEPARQNRPEGQSVIGHRAGHAQTALDTPQAVHPGRATFRPPPGREPPLVTNTPGRAQEIRFDTQDDVGLRPVDVEDQPGAEDLLLRGHNLTGVEGLQLQMPCRRVGRQEFGDQRTRRGRHKGRRDQGDALATTTGLRQPIANRPVHPIPNGLLVPGVRPPDAIRIVERQDRRLGVSPKRATACRMLRVAVKFDGTALARRNQHRGCPGRSGQGGGIQAKRARGRAFGLVGVRHDLAPAAQPVASRRGHCGRGRHKGQEPPPADLAIPFGARAHLGLPPSRRGTERGSLTATAKVFSLSSEDRGASQPANPGTSRPRNLRRPSGRIVSNDGMRCSSPGPRGRA